MDRSRLLGPTIILFALSFTATLAAQEGGRRRQGGGFGGGFAPTIDKPTLLGSPQVLAELKIKDEQKKKIDEILAAHRQESMELFSSSRSRDPSPEEREKRSKERAEKTAELRKKTESKLETALEKDQTTRLNEIELQQRDVDALVSEPVVASLKLQKEQVEKIQAALKTRDEELQKLGGGRGGFGGRGAGGKRGPDAKEGGQGGGGDFQAIREQTEKVRKTATEAGLAVLSKEQRDELEKLKGKPFELDRRSLLRGGREGRPGGQGGDRSGGAGGGGGERRRPPPDEI